MGSRDLADKEGAGGSAAFEMELARCRVEGIGALPSDRCRTRLLQNQVAVNRYLISERVKFWGQIQSIG